VIQRLRQQNFDRDQHKASTSGRPDNIPETTAVASGGMESVDVQNAGALQSKFPSWMTADTNAALRECEDEWTLARGNQLWNAVSSILESVHVSVEMGSDVLVIIMIYLVNEPFYKKSFPVTI